MYGYMDRRSRYTPVYNSFLVLIAFCVGSRQQIKNEKIIRKYEMVWTKWENIDLNKKLYCHQIHHGIIILQSIPDQKLWNQTQFFKPTEKWLWH